MLKRQRVSICREFCVALALAVMAVTLIAPLHAHATSGTPEWAATSCLHGHSAEECLACCIFWSLGAALLFVLAAVAVSRVCLGRASFNPAARVPLRTLRNFPSRAPPRH